MTEQSVHLMHQDKEGTIKRGSESKSQEERWMLEEREWTDAWSPLSSLNKNAGMEIGKVSNSLKENGDVSRCIMMEQRLYLVLMFIIYLEHWWWRDGHECHKKPLKLETLKNILYCSFYYLYFKWLERRLSVGSFCQCIVSVYNYFRYIPGITVV